MEESETRRRSFRFIPGPVFCQLLMADRDESRRPRTQAARCCQRSRRAGDRHRHDHQVSPALPRAGDPESHRAGDASPLARGAARPLPFCRSTSTIRTRRRTAHDDRDHGRQHSPRCVVMTAQELLQARSLLRRVPVARPCGRRHSQAESAPSHRRLRVRDRRSDRLGARAARQPGIDAGGARARPAAGPTRAVDRRRPRSGAAGVAPPHGA